MARCEDHPACGHESGCCPDFDEDGKQLNMVCTCGAKLPVTSRYSICDSCMDRGDDDDYGGSRYGGGYDDDRHERWHAEY